jgi:phage terminase small subunit
MITDKQQVWMHNYVLSYNATDAARKAGYANPVEDGQRNLRNKEIAKMIRAHFEELKDSSFYNESVIIQNLWREALNEGPGSTHSARITALVWLGKHIGMWQDRIKETAEDKKIVYNIVNYNTLQEKITENKDDIEKEKQRIEENIPEGIEIADYNTLQ